MARTPLFLLGASAMLLAACGHGSQDKLAHAIDAGRQQSEQQAAADPAQRPHPDDSNLLRRKLSDTQIWQLFFGPTQTQGDWIAYLPCTQSEAGLPVAPYNRIYLKRCPALQQYLLARARSAGFFDATARDVMDPRISGARPHDS